MATSDRLLELSSIGQDRSRIALSLDRVRRIDLRLASDWGIEFFSGRTLRDLVRPESRYWVAHDAVADALSRNADNELLEQLEGKRWPRFFGQGCKWKSAGAI